MEYREPISVSVVEGTFKAACSESAHSHNASDVHETFFANENSRVSRASKF